MEEEVKTEAEAVEESLTTEEKLERIQTELEVPKGQLNKFGGYRYRSCEDILPNRRPRTGWRPVLYRRHGEPGGRRGGREEVFRYGLRPRGRREEGHGRESGYWLRFQLREKIRAKRPTRH